MIKLITETICSVINVIAHLEEQKRIEELTVDRPENTFGGTPSLTWK